MKFKSFLSHSRHVTNIEKIQNHKRDLLKSLDWLFFVWWILISFKWLLNERLSNSNDETWDVPCLSCASRRDFTYNFLNNISNVNSSLFLYYCVTQKRLGPFLAILLLSIYSSRNSWPSSLLLSFARAVSHFLSNNNTWESKIQINIKNKSWS